MKVCCAWSVDEILTGASAFSDLLTSMWSLASLLYSLVLSTSHRPNGHSGGLSPLLTPSFDAEVDSLLAAWNSPGLAVALVRKNPDGLSWTVETKGYGIETHAGKAMDDQASWSGAVALARALADVSFSPFSPSLATRSSSRPFKWAC